MKKFLYLAVLFMMSTLIAAPLTVEQKAKVDEQIKSFSSLSTDPAVIKAVKDFTASPAPELKDMTQEKWAKLSVLSPEIKALTKNTLAEYLKTKKTAIVAELFVSSPNGEKVAFFGKTSSWSHKGKPKHDVPMTGKTWIGESEQDESSGKQTVQFGIPVLDSGKAIGSIVIGLDLGLLK